MYSVLQINSHTVCTVRTYPNTNLSSYFEQKQQARIFDIFDPDNDVCYDESTDAFGPCDEAKFPSCDPDDELICFNRRPFRDRFYADNRNPYYYIDYRSVFCYPAQWGGCSSCSPGRYCKSEKRCILEENDYPCAQWI